MAFILGTKRNIVSGSYCNQLSEQACLKIFVGREGKMSGILSTTLGVLDSDSYCNLTVYRDQKFQNREEQENALKTSSTLYVGNLSFYTTEEQIHELFSKCGDVKRIIMGLDKVKKTPCGFCFVEYYTRAEAEHCMRFINGTRLDDRVIQTDWDAGFQEGRQFGRGKTGGQMHDEYRRDYDVGRGGFGKIIQMQKTNQQTVIY